MRIGVTGQFKGAVPKLSEKLLPNGFAKEAINCDLRSGKLAALKDTLRIMEIPKPGDIRTIYKLDDTWLYWDSYVDVVRSQISGTTRIFYTGDGYPKQTNKAMATSGGESTYPTEHQRLGVIVPEQGLVLETDEITDGLGYGDVIFSVSWVYTRVSEFDGVEDESAPSPPTSINPIDFRENEGATLTGFVPGDPTNNVVSYRIYRIATGTTGDAEWQLLPWSKDSDGNPIYDMPITENTFIDADDSLGTLKQNIGRVCPSQNWECPPDDLTGLKQFQNGLLAGFVGKQPYISDTFIPYGYPETYRKGMAMGLDIVAFGMFMDQMFVVNGAEPWVIGGSDPGYLQKMEIPISQACLSARGLVVVPSTGVLYPSPDGIVLTDGTGGSVLTKEIWTKEQWQAMSPSLLIGAFYDGKYYGFFEGTSQGFILDWNEAHVVTLNLGARLVYGLHVVPEDDTLYLIIYENGSYYIEAWEKGTEYLTYTWTLPLTETSCLGFSCGKFEGATGSVNFTLTADGVERHSSNIETGKVFRLPGGYQAKEWAFNLNGSTQIDSVVIAQRVNEL